MKANELSLYKKINAFERIMAAKQNKKLIDIAVIKKNLKLPICIKYIICIIGTTIGEIKNKV